MHRRNPYRVFGFLTAALVFFGLLAPVDRAVALPPAALDAITGPVIAGATVDVHGTNFAADTQLAVWLDTNGNNTFDTDEPIAPAVKDDVLPPYRVMTAADGSFSTKLLIDHVSAGHDAVVAAPCDKGDDMGWNVFCGGTTGTASTPLDVALSASPSQFGSGQDVTVTAVDLAPSTTATVWFDKNNNGVFDTGETSMTPTTAADGSVSTTLTVFAFPPGGYQIGVTTPGTTFLQPIDVQSCFVIDECAINDTSIQCLIGFAPTDPFADCKQLDTNYSKPRPGETDTNTPPGGYNLKNDGVHYPGAGVFAAITNTFGVLLNPASLIPTIPELATPGTGCFAIQAAIALANGYGDAVPDAGWDAGKPLTDLTDIACGNVIPPTPVSPPIPLGPAFDAVGYIAANALFGQTVPDQPFVLGLIGAIIAAAGAVGALGGIGCAALAGVAGPAATTAALGAGVDPVTAQSIAAGITGIVLGFAAAVCAAIGPVLSLAILAAVQQLFAVAAVAGAIACGRVDYHCDGSQITGTSIGSPTVQTSRVPVPVLSDFTEEITATKLKPNPCRTVLSPSQRCWGQVIGWSQVTCTYGNAPACEAPDVDPATKQVITPLQFSHLPVPGSAGPNNVNAPIKCATGPVGGLSQGFDGDLSLDINDSPDENVPGPSVKPLVNYHNFLPGPGGSESPHGIDIEIPLKDRVLFPTQIARLRPGMQVKVCGRWVADMHQLWNELHPVTSLDILESDLSLTKTATTPAVAGQTLSYDLQVTNHGPSDASAVKISDPLPPGTTFEGVSIPAGWNCTTPATGANGTVECDTDVLANGASATVSINVTVPANTPDGTVLTNDANVSSPTSDPTPGNNAASTPVTVTTKADVSMLKTGPATATGGTDVTYTIKINSSGPSDAQSVAFSDTLASDASLVSFSQGGGPAFACTTGPVHCTLGTLAAGASALFTLVVHLSPSIPNGSTRCNTASATTTTTDTDATNDSSTTCAIVVTRADLALSQRGSTTGTPGNGTATFNYTLRNLGPSDSQNVAFSTRVRFKIAPLTPPQVITADPGCTVVGMTVACHWNTVALAETKTFSVVVRWRSSVGDVCDDAAVVSDTVDPVLTNNQSSLCVLKR